MSITVIVLIVEVIIVLLGLVCFLFFLRWKRKKNKMVELNQLLDDINSKEEERKAVLTKHLVKGYALGDEAAKELSSYMVEAEKQFLQQFVKQQIEQSSLTSFYETLCELLDQYLYFIPQGNTEKDLPASSEQEIVSDSQNLEEEPKNIEKVQEDEDVVANAEEIATTEESQEEIGEPDWGDAFSESGDEMDTEAKAGLEAEDTVVSEGDEETDEPDWGDAFSESGDAIDESTKAGYESEVKKES